MTKFIGAVRTGLNSAEIAKSNRLKIKETWKSLADAVETISNGKVTIRLISSKALISEDAFTAFTHFLTGKKLFDSLVLEEKSAAPKRKIQIARFQQSTSGFPCTVAVGSDEYICNDIESLDNVLSKIMRSTTVGLSISELLSSEIPNATQDRISEPTDQKNQRTVEGQVNILSKPGKVTAQPFDSKVIREVSGGGVHIRANASMRADPTVIRGSKLKDAEVLVKNDEPLQPKAVANLKETSREVISNPTAKKTLPTPTSRKRTTKVEEKRLPTKAIAKPVAKTNVPKTTSSKATAK